MTRVADVVVGDTLRVRREYAPVPSGDADILDDVLLRDSETGEFVGAHCRLVGDDAAVLADRLRVWGRGYGAWFGKNPTKHSFRLSGINNQHRTFGFAAPSPLRQNYGSRISRFNLEEPDAALLLDRLAVTCWEQFEDLLPAAARSHREITDAIHPGWLMGGGLSGWTSGIVNRTAALPYHRDSGNLPASWSAMVVLRSRIDGGHLDIPELGTVLRCDDLSLTLFNGQSYLHGVTPFTSRSNVGYRLSVVFYTKSAFANAAAPGVDEIRRAQKRATENADSHRQEAP